jgi:hypothetical protein
MAGGGLTEQQILQLANDVSAKLLSSRDLLKHCDGTITIKVFPRGMGFDIKVTFTR